MKKLIGKTVLALALLISVAPAALSGPSILVDVTNGVVLAAKEPHRRWYPASLTKLMTAYLALKAIRDTEKTEKSPVVITQNAASEPPSKMGYPVGSKLTLENAIKIMMVKSANDVSVAVGESIAGSEVGFVKMMNAEAERLGMAGTRFANPHGLPDKRQYTTARDLAVLVSAMRREFPDQTRFYKLEAIQAGNKLMENYNVLIGRFDGADGMKTGFICASGFNLAASATRNGRTLTAIVLGAKGPEERAERAANMLAEGFAQPAEGKPDLAAYRPDIQPVETTDMRPVICTKAARSWRWNERDSEGRMIFRTPHLRPMGRDPFAEKVALGGTVGEPTEVFNYADVPIPTTRPDYTAPVEITETSFVADAASVEENPALQGTIVDGIPIPTPRPVVSQ